MRVVRTAGCFLEYKNKFLILQRRDGKTQAETWGLPAGKVQSNESDIEAVIREIKEETGYNTTKNALEFLGEYVWNFPEYTVEFPTFRVRLNKQTEIKHNPDEHQGYKWVTPEECYEMNNLIHGLHDLLEKVGYIKSS